MKNTMVKKWMFLFLALVLAFTLAAQVEPALAGISTTPSGPVCRSCSNVEPVVSGQRLYQPQAFTFVGAKLPLLPGELWR